MKYFWSIYWLIWGLMLLVGDPLAVWLGRRDHIGDGYTDTHFIVTHVSIGLRVGILAWLVYHFLVAHKIS